MRRKFLSVVLCVCMMMTMVPFAFAADDTGSGSSSTSSTTIDFATFVQEVTKAGYNYDGNGITVQWSPASGCYQLGNSNHYKTTQENCVAGSAAVTGNTPTKVNSFLAQYLVFSQAENVVIKNVNFVFAPATFSLCQNAGSVSPTTNKKDDYVGTWDTDHVKSAQLYLTNSGNTTIENCSFDHVVFTSWQNTEKTEIKNSSFKNIYDSYGIKDLGGNSAEVSGCTFENCGGGVMLNSNAARSASTTVSITGNTFKNVDVADTAPEDKAGTRGLIQIAKTGDYTDTTFEFSGNTAENCGPVLRQLNSTVSLDTTPLNSLVGAGAATLYTTDSIQPVATTGDTSYTSVSAAVNAITESGTVTLLKDTIEDVTIPAGKTITLDLNGHKIVNSSAAQNNTVADNLRKHTITNNGTLTIMDSVGTGVVDNVSHQRAALYNAGTITEIKGGKFTRSVDNSTDASSANGNSWYVVYNAEGATITEISAGDFLAVGKFSSLFCNSGTIGEISGGTFTQDGFIAFKNEGTVNKISGGIFSSKDESCIQNWGTISEICGGTITAGNIGIWNFSSDKYSSPGKVENISGGEIKGTTAAIRLHDYDASYLKPSAPSKTNKASVTISDGKINGALQVNDNTTLTVSGGYFTSDPSNYLTSGKAAVESDLAGYNYKVDVAKDEKADVAAAKPEVSIPVLTGADKEAATAVSTALSASTDTVTGDGLTAAANTIANDNNTSVDDGKDALKDIVTDTTTTRIVIQTYMDIDITDVNTADASKTLTLDITPMYRTVATTATNDSDISLSGDSRNAVDMGKSGTLTINKPVTVKIPLPTNFASAGNSVYVQHKGYEYTASVSNESGTLYATFVNPHGFSSFTITATQTAVAKIGDTSYTSLQAAVDAVKDDETITLTKACSETATVSRNVKFTLDTTAGAFSGTISASGRYNLTKVDGATANTTDYTVTYVGGSSSGSGSASTTYNVTVNAATNGTAAADKKTAAKGTTVTITATPSAGYVVDAVKVVDKDGKDVAVTAKDGKYVFTMPASAVTVTATFKAETPAPSGLPFVDVKSGDWFYDAVKYAYEQGLMTGTSATTFAPNGTMNRAMIVTVLYRLEKSPAVTAPAKFADVPAGQWYSDAVAWAAANNIVNGYNETTFGPMNAVTREQMAAILYRYEQYKGMDTVTLEENLSRFPDKDKVSAYAVPAMQWAVGQKVINGNADGTLNPTGTATRAQVAQIFTNLLNK